MSGPGRSLAGSPLPRSRASSTLSLDPIGADKNKATQDAQPKVVKGHAEQMAELAAQREAAEKKAAEEAARVVGPENPLTPKPKSGSGNPGESLPDFSL